MNVALISDIHGNLVALETVLEEIQREAPDRIVCLGDVVHGGPEPIAALERIRELDCPVINGNTDEWLLSMEMPDEYDEQEKPQETFDIGEWTADRLTTAHERFIESFEDTVEIELPGGSRLLCYHATPQSPWGRLEVETPDAELDQIIESTDADVLVGGHNHNQMLRRYLNVTFVNTGSVGMPFGTTRSTREALGGYQPWAEWAMIEATDDGFGIDLRRTRLDVDAVIQSHRESDVPHSELLIEGWEAGRSGDTES